MITKLPNMTQLVPRNITGGKTLQGIVDNEDGQAAPRRQGGEDAAGGRVHVRRQRPFEDGRLQAPRARREQEHAVKGTGRTHLDAVALRAGKYTYSSVGKPKLKRTFKVV